MVSIMPICDLSMGYENCRTSGRPRYAQPLIRTNPDAALGDMKRLLGSGFGSLTAVNENELYKKITARQGLHGAVIEFAIDHPTSFSFIVVDNRARFANPITFTKGTSVNGTPFEVEVIANNKIKLFRQSDRAPLYISGHIVYAVGPNITGVPTSDHFYLAGNSNGGDYIDLDQISFYDFLRKFWTLTSVLTGNTFRGPVDSLRFWDSRTNQLIDVPRAMMIFLRHSPILERLRVAMLDPLFKARCCMGQNPSEDQILCDAIGSTKNNQACDLFMPEFCTTHPDDPYCGCYDANVQKEYDALPAELKTPTYRPILQANPRCWVKGCTTGYIPPNYRDMGNCKITICDVNQTIIGENYIKNLSGEIMCEGGVPMQNKPPSTGTGSGSSGSGSTGSGSSGSGSTGSGSTGSGSSGSGSSGSGSTPPETESESFTLEDLPWGGILAILFLIIIVLVAVLLVAKKKKDTLEVQQVNSDE